MIPASLPSLARALGGEVSGNGGGIVCPGPGHSPKVGVSASNCRRARLMASSLFPLWRRLARLP